ncbi:MAG: acetylxylan esterase [Clostridiales bacterium]
MPIIDMSVEELKKYQGINPCPKDFDSFWDKGLDEMKNTDSNVELVKSHFETPFAECFDLYFTGVKGSRIHAKYLRPKNTKKGHPAIIRFHGYQSNSGDWSENLGYVALGFSLAYLDCRGQGGISEDLGGIKGTTAKGHIIRGLDDKPENLLFRQIFLDTAQLASIVMDMPEVDEKRVGVQGGSQGGALSLVCASLEPRISRIVTHFPFLSDYKRVWEMDLAEGAYEELKIYFRKFDPRHEKEDEIFTKLGYIDIQNLVKRIRGEVLFVTGLMDTICPPSTQFATYNKIKAKKNILIYPDYGHEGSYPDYEDRAYEFLSKL